MRNSRLHMTRVLLAAALICGAFAPAPLAGQAAAASQAPSIWPERPGSTGAEAGAAWSRAGEVRIRSSAAARRPRWVLPVVGAVSGAAVMHLAYHPPCEGCIYIPPAVVGAALGAVVGTVIEMLGEEP